MKYKINDNELIYMIRENDEDYLNVLFTKYKPIIINISNYYYDLIRNMGVEFDDVIQEANIALYNAYRNYNSNCDYKFYTYANRCIRNHLNTYVRDLNVKKHQILNNSLSIDNISYDVFYKINDNSYEKDFIYIKNLFNFDNSIVFELRYNGFTYREISILLDIPISSVDGRLCKIRSILKKYMV